MPSLRALAVGWRAHAALGRSGGRAVVLARLSGSLYLRAGGEIVWLGLADAPLHARAVLVADLPAGAAGARLSLDPDGPTPWRPPLPWVGAPPVDALVSACRRLRAGAAALGPPAGLGVLLAGAVPQAPLDRAAPHVRALALACGQGDAEGAARAAVPLLGLGPGLTPAGDDLVGGAFFGRVLLARGTAGAEAWARAAGRVRAHAAGRTHPVSEALLGDLLGGEGPAPLHALLAGLAAPGARGVGDLAQGVVRLGHSSGWDLLAGLLAGLAGERAL